LGQTVYEGMFILESGRYGRDPEGVSGRLAKIIEDAGGEMLVSRLWEERRLAFPIKGHRKGTYWLTYFRLDSGRLTGIRRQCQLNDDILRQLLLKVDPRIVDTLVAHALTATVVSPSQLAAEQAQTAEKAAAAGEDDEDSHDSKDEQE
jgi:small subunit ribosomal protein S6